jgi:hypothetical protein
VESAISRPAVPTFPLGVDPRCGSPPWDRRAPRIQAIDPRSHPTVAILVEALPATANQDTAAIPKRQAVAIRNRRTIPTTPNTIRVNMPNKPVPECPCPFSDTLTLPSTFLTEQDNEGYRQLSLRPPRSSLGIPYPACWRFFSLSYSCFGYLFDTASRSFRLVRD